MHQPQVVQSLPASPMTMVSASRGVEVPRSDREPESDARSGSAERRLVGKARGVTLVEVLIVVAILALIAGGVAIFAIPKFQQAQKDTAKTDCKTLVQVVETFKLNHPAAITDCPTVEKP